MSQEQIKDFDIGTKINDEPSGCILADGHIIGADEYVTTACVNGEEKTIIVSVFDPTKSLGSVPITEVTPALGLNFLNNFDVLFKGKQQKIALFKCQNLE